MGAPSEIGNGSGPIIFFDGICNLCNGAVQFIIARDPGKKFSFVSLQSPTAIKLLGSSVPEAASFYSIILLKNEKIFDRSDAVLEIARDLNNGWSLLYCLRFLPRFFRDGLYNMIARNRYQLFGKQNSCMIPTPELRARFLD